jgi:hypothetical protein
MWVSLILLFPDPNGEFTWDGSRTLHGLQIGDRVRREVVEYDTHMREREAIQINNRLIRLFGDKWRTPMRRIPLTIRKHMTVAEIKAAMHASDPVNYPLA